MKTIYPSKTYTISVFLFLLFSTITIAQVGIGNTSPNANSLLEIGDGTDTKGVLLPRVSLSTTNSPSPLAADIAGMIVYNTNTNGAGATAVSPGFYYNDDWKTTGNAGTTAGTNFLGTTDNVSLELFTNNTTRMRVENDGQVSIGLGAGSVNANQQFNVRSTFTNGTAIGGYSGGSGRGVYGQNISNGYGVYGINTTNGQAVRGYNSGTGWGVGARSNNATGIGLVAYNTNTIGAGLIASGANAPLSYLGSTGATLNGVMGGVAFSTSATGTGFSGTGNGSITVSTLITGSGIAGSGNTGVYGLSTAASNGTGIIGSGGNSSAITTNSTGSGIAGSSLTMGVFGYAGNGDDVAANYGNAGGEFVLDGDNDPTTNSTDSESNRARAILAGFNNINPPSVGGGSQPSYFGGYFSGGNENGGNQNYSYTALRFSIGADGTVGGSTTDFKIVGPGSVSTLIKDSEGTPRILFAPEAPEILFQDFGVGKLVNGQARINIDPILKGSLFIDNEHPLKVYVTLEGECNGIYVTP